MKFLDKLSSDVLFVLLGFVLGSTLGAALFLTLLPEPAQYGGSFITAGGAVFAATVGALMIRHQLRENYVNQIKLDKIRYVSQDEVRSSISEIMLRLNQFKGSLLEGDGTEEQVHAAGNAYRDVIEVLAPVSVTYLRMLKQIYLDFWYHSDDPFFNEHSHRPVYKTVEELVAAIDQVRGELIMLKLGNKECEIINSD